MVSALGTVFAVEDTSETGASLLQDQIRGAWGLPTGLSLLAWYVFAPQCLATFAVLRRETQSRRWTIVTFVYLLLLAYIAAFTTYHIATLF
jgi:ferrous iron transport protein B